VTGQWNRPRLRYRIRESCLRAEAGELDLGNGYEPRHREADAGADDRRLRDRRVEHARIAELVEEPVGDAEDTAVVADVLAEQDDPFVASHLGGQRVVDGREHRHGRHEMSPSSRPSDWPATRVASSARSRANRGLSAAVT
jgi:hypothetical protein